MKRATLYAYVSRGVLKSYRQGIKRQRLYRRADVEDLLRLAGPERRRRGPPWPNPRRRRSAQPKPSPSSSGAIPAAESWIRGLSPRLRPGARASAPPYSSLVHLAEEAVQHGSERLGRVQHEVVIRAGNLRDAHVGDAPRPCPPAIAGGRIGESSPRTSRVGAVICGRSAQPSTGRRAPLHWGSKR